jgi:predicted GNAT family acetyltransferase
VGGGSYIPVGAVAEIVGVGVLPAYRRRGLARHLTYVLATDASQRGVSTIFCSAQSAEVARVYEAVGFRRVGTACIASVAAS